jgi:hypothetical protein
MFIDEGAGRYNPAPVALDEAVINEWPGREVGVFLSIGTGKRPSGTNAQQHLWWEGFVSGGIGDFAEARRRLISKIEGCEDTHQWMLHERLMERGINAENYYRLNVDVGVGEFGMNEWNRLSEISTNTRMYLAQTDVQSKNISASSKLARILRQNWRWDRAISNGEIPDPNYPRNSWEYQEQVEPEPPSVPGAVELPADDVPNRPMYIAGHTPSNHSATASSSSSSAPAPASAPPPPAPLANHRRTSDEDKFIVHADEPYRYEPRKSTESSVPQRLSNQANPSITVTPPPSRPGVFPPPSRRSDELHRPISSNGKPLSQHGGPQVPPPLPPKTPLQGAARPVASTSATMNRPPGGVLPYPDTDGPPPMVNIARKPEYGVR